MTNFFVKICFFFLAHVPSKVPLCVGNLAITANPMIFPINGVYIPNATTLES